MVSVSFNITKRRLVERGCLTPNLSSHDAVDAVLILGYSIFRQVQSLTSYHENLLMTDKFVLPLLGIETILFGKKIIRSCFMYDGQQKINTQSEPFDGDRRLSSNPMI